MAITCIDERFDFWDQDGVIYFHSPENYVHQARRASLLASDMSQNVIDQLLLTSHCNFDNLSPVTGQALIIAIEKRYQVRQKAMEKQKQKRKEFHETIIKEIQDLMKEQTEFRIYEIQLAAYKNHYPVRTRQMYTAHLVNELEKEEPRVYRRSGTVKTRKSISTLRKDGSTTTQSIPISQPYVAYYSFKN